MADSKKKVKEVTKEVETKVKETAKKVADKVQEKGSSKKAEEVPVTETKAEEPKKKVAVKKPSIKKAAPKTEIILQYSGKEILYNDLVKKAVQISKKALKKKDKEVKDVKVYVKPEENMAYYVANGGDDIGSFGI